MRTSKNYLIIKQHVRSVPKHNIEL